jgi:hypothetical protein
MYPSPQTISKTAGTQNPGEQEKEKPNPNTSKNSGSDLRGKIDLFLKINHVWFEDFNRYGINLPIADLNRWT